MFCDPVCTSCDLLYPWLISDALLKLDVNAFLTDYSLYVVSADHHNKWLVERSGKTPWTVFNGMKKSDSNPQFIFRLKDVTSNSPNGTSAFSAQALCGHHHSLYGLRKGTADLAKFERAYEASRAEESTCPEVVNETELAAMNEKLKAGYKRCTEALERGLDLSHEEVMPVFEPWVRTLSSTRCATR